MTASEDGIITTFYSYKGGTGRTMALANVAWILAANGERVLMVDWDLEAPGLHRFFLPFMSDPDLRESDGLVDMVSEYVDALGNQGKGARVAPDILRLADPRRQAIALQFDFDKEGCLHLLAAGRQDQRYAERVRGLDWQQFYTSFGGEAFIRQFATVVRQQYDHMLIDSRTGVADSAGICTMELPHQVVLCFTYNRQSVEGAAAVANSISRYAESVGRPINLLPLPTRVIPDIEGLEGAREFAQRALAPHLPDLKNPDDLLAFWASAEVPHYAAYGFEETLATFRERAGGRNNLLADMEWLTGQIGGTPGPMPFPKMPTDVRERYLHRFRLRNPRRAALDEALSGDPSTALWDVRAMLSEAEDESVQDTGWIATLAKTLQNLADRLDERGSREEAVRANHEAVLVFRHLDAERPSEYRAAHAAALFDFAKRLSAVGRRDSALAPAHDAADLYRELALKEPNKYRPAHAAALTSLASRLSEIGRRQEAVAPAAEATYLYRAQAEQGPNAYRSALASALSNLAKSLSEVGQRQEALAPAEEAATLYRELAAKAPDAYSPDLAGSLNNWAISLSAAGQCQEALSPAKEAVDLYRELAAKAPDAYSPHLAMALHNLALRLSEVDQRQEALHVAEEAVRTLAPQFLTLPAAFVSWMRRTVQNYQARCRQVGKEPDMELLAPILELLQRMQEGSQDEVPANGGLDA